MSAFEDLRALGRGLATTARTLGTRAHTRQYPHQEPDLPDRSRGVIALLEENCTSCMLCARECPDWCIYIDSHKETLEPGPEGGRARQHNVLDRFDIDFSLCMYCGICIEVCPFDALFWAPDFAYAEGDIRNLLHDKEKLGTWMERVPDSSLPEAVREQRAGGDQGGLDQGGGDQAVAGEQRDGGDQGIAGEDRGDAGDQGTERGVRR